MIVKIEYVYFVEYNNRYSTIRLICDDDENRKIILSGEGDCCSSSWIEILDKPFEECIGKTYLNCIDTGEEIDIGFSEVQDYDINHIYKITFTDNSSFCFLLRNSSNGYYDGWLNEKITSIHPNGKIISRHKLVLLVGLPGCGKSQYAKLLYERKAPNMAIYDDIDIGLQINIDNIRRDLLNKTVFVVNTRLCISETYYDFIDRINLLDKEDGIETLCFLPDIEQSIANIKAREGENIIRQEKFIADIYRYKDYYSVINTTTPFGYNCGFIPTYSPKNTPKIVILS